MQEERNLNSKANFTFGTTNRFFSRGKMVQVMFEKYGFADVYVAIQTVLLRMRKILYQELC